jgi:glucose-1-phosphate adenylyltransferase
MHEVLCLILGGGRGTRLYPLTRTRSEPAVPIAGKYRLIDIPVSNCLNSNLGRIYVLTQYMSVSLHRHIANTYKFDPFSQGFVTFLAAQQTNDKANWYQGTADAVRQHLHYVKADDCREVLILCGDQLYRMDFRELRQTHRDSQADVTLAVVPVRREQASRLGIVRLDDTHRIVDLFEKPQTPEQLDRLRTPASWLEARGLAGGGREYLANMGIYLFRRQALFDLLEAHPQATDLVTELFAPALRSHRLQAHFHRGYWEDLGSIQSYFEAHLALAGDPPPFDFHVPEGDIYTRMRYLPASRIQAAALTHCLVSDGCVVQAGTRMERCLVGIRSRIGRDVTLRDTVILGANRTETDAQLAHNRQRGIPAIGIGDGAVIERAILDKDCRIGRGVQIRNRDQVARADGPNYAIRDGIVVIPNGAVVADGTVL